MPRIRRALAILFEGYRSHHESNEKLLEWIGIVGSIAFPAIYLLRFTGKFPPLYDDLPWRATAVLLCLGLALRRWWPRSAKPYYLPFSWLAVFYSLAFFLPFTLLQNQASTPTVVNTVLSAILIILLTDWRNTVAMLVGGYLSSALAHAIVHPQPALPVQFLIWWVPLCSVLVAGGSISKYVAKRSELARMRQLYAGLAGSIAHEMRNPLAQVQHALDTLAAGLPPPSRAGQPATLTAEQLAEMSTTVERGRQAVARGLQAIQVTLQQLKPRSLEAQRFTRLSALACVRDAVDDYAYDDAGQRTKVVIQCVEDFEFLGERTAFTLVLFNLLKNALYYSPLHPEATVTVTVRTQPEPQVVVRDTGPGIAPELLPRLFQDFQTSGKPEGTGLGLAFCRRVMHAFGGEITCRSEPGAFAEFTLAFPAKLPAASRSGAPDDPASGVAAPASARAQLAGKTVLLVDDEPLNRAITRARLADLGLQVREAEHGQQALDLLQAGPAPQFVLMDVNMPGINGIETTRRLRALPLAAARVPVLAVTGNNSAAVVQAARAAGMDAVLLKPLDMDQLLAELDRLLAPDLAHTVAPRAGLPPGEELLATRRLDEFRRLGVLDELLPECLSGLHRQMERLRQGVTAGDASLRESALHNLVGLSGEAGAHALHLACRSRYEDLLEGRSAPDAAWLADAQALFAATETALLRDYGSPASTPPGQTSSHSLRV